MGPSLGNVFIDFIRIAFEVYTWMIIARIIFSWIKVNPDNPAVRFIIELTEPFLSIFRKFIPNIGMIDISPIVAIFALHLIQSLIVQILVSVT